jgi:DNA-binding LytR/AlgR family response regulator
MKILIIEDEPHAARRLETLVRELVPDVEIVAHIDTVKNAVRYFSGNPAPDLTLMDIQLSDGISFDIFRQCEVSSPVIFTTAYDEYALKAFKVNSIDYILKPIDKDELRAALDKFKLMNPKPALSGSKVIGNLEEVVRMLTRKYKTRFMIKVGEHLRTVEVSEILFFFSQEKTTFCVTADNRKLILDHTMEDLEDMVDPQAFYRINRKYLVSSHSIKDIIQFTNSRLKLVLKNCNDNEVIVAREKVGEFKSWLDR